MVVPMEQWASQPFQDKSADLWVVMLFDHNKKYSDRMERSYKAFAVTFELRFPFPLMSVAWAMWHISHGRLIIVVVYDMAHIWHQGICDHPVDLSSLVRTRSVQIGFILLICVVSNWISLSIQQLTGLPLRRKNILSTVYFCLRHCALNSKIRIYKTFITETKSICMN